jgi:hypothetical protein
MDLSRTQIKIIESDLGSSLFLSGPAGTGKSTAGVERLNFLVGNGIPGNKILLLFPQRTLSSLYQDSINSVAFQGGSLPVIATFGGLARRTIELYWPLLAAETGLFDPDKLPTFLTLESTLYFMSQLITPLVIDGGYFSSVTIQRNRLFSQILDNLNKAAIHGFPHTEISERLQSSWIGDPSQLSIFQDAQNAAALFREYCYQHNLLDYSLQIELYVNHLIPHQKIKDHFKKQFKHLVYDNVEEDVPVAHDFIKDMLPSLDSSLLIYDLSAGYRNFLGASPSGGMKLADFCTNKIELSQTYTMSPALVQFNSFLSASLESKSLIIENLEPELTDAVSVNFHPYYPQMVAWVASKIKELVEGGTSPDEIVVLAPFLSDSLRFLLSSELAKQQIESTSHRPSRALRDEPVTHCLLTLSALAHPDWEILPTIHELAFAFMQFLESFDLTRSYLLAKHCFQTFSKESRLDDFENFPSGLQERITFSAGNRYQSLVNWLRDYRNQPPQPLDHFQIRMFGELLSQPGYGFHNDFDKGQISEQTIDSIRKFRLSAGEVLGFTNLQLGSEYYRMVKTGVLANQHPRSWTRRPKNAVYLTPAYTFLLSNTPSDYQFWLDVGSRGWYERIFQPLTNPHVLNRDWEIGMPWRDTEEYALNHESLNRLSSGLVRRCRKGIFFCLTNTDERGFEQKGLLIKSLNKVLKIIRSAEQNQA